MNDSNIQKFYYQSGDKLIALNGLNDLTVNNNISFAEHFMLGGVESSIQINAPQQIEVSFNRSFIAYDDLFKYTGSNPISKVYIYNGDRFYYLNNLYLNTYSASFTVGDIPKISTKFILYGSQMYQDSYPSLDIIDYVDNIDIPKLNSISITGTSADKIKNLYNIFSFDYNLEVNRQPYYNIGSEDVSEVCEILPIKINFSITSKIKDENNKIDSIEIMQDNLNFDISVSGSLQTMSFPVRKAQLMSTELIMSNSNTLDFKRNFIGYYGL